MASEAVTDEGDAPAGGLASWGWGRVWTAGAGRPASPVSSVLASAQPACAGSSGPGEEAHLWMGGAQVWACEAQTGKGLQVLRESSRTNDPLQR